jgi:hypothetical protein
MRGAASRGSCHILARPVRSSLWSSWSGRGDTCVASCDTCRALMGAYVPRRRRRMCPLRARRASCWRTPAPCSCSSAATVTPAGAALTAARIASDRAPSSVVMFLSPGCCFVRVSGRRCRPSPVTPSAAACASSLVCASVCASAPSQPRLFAVGTLGFRELASCIASSHAPALSRSRCSSSRSRAMCVLARSCSP